MREFLEVGAVPRAAAWRMGSNAAGGAGARAPLPVAFGLGARTSRLALARATLPVGVTALTKDALQLWLAVVTIIVAIGALAFTLNGQLRDDLREVRDEVRALRKDVQDLGERVTRVEVLIEGGGRIQVDGGGTPTVTPPGND